MPRSASPFTQICHSVSVSLTFPPLSPQSWGMVTKSPNVPAPGARHFPCGSLGTFRNICAKLLCGAGLQSPGWPAPSALCWDPGDPRLALPGHPWNVAEEPLYGGFPCSLSPSAHPLISEHKVGQSGLGVGGGTPNANSSGRGLWREASPHGRRPSPGTACAGRAGEARKPLSVGTQSTSLRGTLGPDLPGPKTTRPFLERIRTPRGREAAGPPHRTTPPLLLEGTDLERWPTGEVTVTPNHSWSVRAGPGRPASRSRVEMLRLGPRVLHSPGVGLPAHVLPREGDPLQEMCHVQPVTQHHPGP